MRNKKSSVCAEKNVWINSHEDPAVFLTPGRVSGKTSPRCHRSIPERVVFTCIMILPWGWLSCIIWQHPEYQTDCHQFSLLLELLSISSSHSLPAEGHKKPWRTIQTEKITFFHRNLLIKRLLSNQLTQQIWSVQTLHIPKRSSTPD